MTEHSILDRSKMYVIKNEDNEFFIGFTYNKWPATKENVINHFKHNRLTGSVKLFHTYPDAMEALKLLPLNCRIVEIQEIAAFKEIAKEDI